MADKNVDLFRAVCFAVLMQNNSGIDTKSPEYIIAKYRKAIDAQGAFAMLDKDNRAKVMAWAELWDKKETFEKLIAQMIEDYTGIPAKEYREKYCS